MESGFLRQETSEVETRGRKRGRAACRWTRAFVFLTQEDCFRIRRPIARQRGRRATFGREGIRLEITRNVVSFYYIGEGLSQPSEHGVPRWKLGRGTVGEMEWRHALHVIPYDLQLSR
jgi:hypothetical protein